MVLVYSLLISLIRSLISRGYRTIFVRTWTLSLYEVYPFLGQGFSAVRNVYPTKYRGLIFENCDVPFLTMTPRP
jgi:hypothetical protein